mmetsp:Transcript_35572/g.87497  ORF Transcript_35572/g.87497 Transcript_35572/m.87497 type:complete len:214 (-) Transcript_35572:872-1513(-)
MCTSLHRINTLCQISGIELSQITEEDEGDHGAPPRPRALLTFCLSCPQPASMSIPRRTRGVAVIPYFASTSTNALTSAGLVGFPPYPSVGLRGMRLTWHMRPLRSLPSSCATSGVSFFPAMRAHSNVIFLPVSATYFLHVDMSSLRGKRTLTGMMASRSASFAACRLTASLICRPSFERRSMRGTSPTVLTVMCRAPMPISVFMRRMAARTFL